MHRHVETWDCGWGVTLCSTSSKTTSVTYQTNVCVLDCVFWLGKCMHAGVLLQGKHYTSRNGLQECDVQESGDTLSSHWITTQTHTGREEPRAWIIQPLSVIIAVHCCFCSSAVLLIAMQRHACAVTPHEYCKTFCLVRHMKTRTLYACYTLWHEDRFGGHVSIFVPASV